LVLFPSKTRESSALEELVLVVDETHAPGRGGGGGDGEVRLEQAAPLPKPIQEVLMLAAEGTIGGGGTAAAAAPEAWYSLLRLRRLEIGVQLAAPELRATLERLGAGRRLRHLVISDGCTANALWRVLEDADAVPAWAAELRTLALPTADEWRRRQRLQLPLPPEEERGDVDADVAQALTRLPNLRSLGLNREQGDGTVVRLSALREQGFLPCLTNLHQTWTSEAQSSLPWISMPMSLAASLLLLRWLRAEAGGAESGQGGEGDGAGGGMGVGTVGRRRSLLRVGGFPNGGLLQESISCALPLGYYRGRKPRA
jgi:hypothetical protein